MRGDVALVLWDVPGRSMNVMTRAGLRDLAACVDAALADPAVRGLVIASGKEAFAGGMDLGVLAGLRAEGAQAIFDAVMDIHALLRRIERAGMAHGARKGARPVACALPGTAAGIGMELALCCHRVFAADRAEARLGLPEIRLGLFPGAGGTTRLVRRLGLLAAAPLLLEGRMLPPRAARAAGLVDEVVPPEALVERAVDWVRAASDADCVKPWDAPGHRIPGGAPYHPAGFPTFVGASAMVTGRTQGVYPAARALLSAAYEGALVDFDTALRIEARWFTHVLSDPAAEAMIRTLFLDKSALEKGARRPDAPAAPVTRLGVLGAGMMGAGIAQAAAVAGIDTVLLDRTAEAAAAGRDRIAAGLERAAGRGRMTRAQADAALGRLTTTQDHAALQGCGLIVEAVVEDPALKARVLARAAAAAPGAVLASNTSTLPVADLARGCPRPEAVVGLHFFSPVDRMQLVEVIAPPQAAPAAVACAFDLARQLGKTPIVVADARFFYANRCIAAFILEAVGMVAEGVVPALVENAARRLGFPLGPLQLVDEVSVELAARILRETRAAAADAGQAEGPAERLILSLEGQGRLGRKAGAGFYDYGADGKRTGLWPGLGPGRSRPPLAQLQERLMFVQALEAVRALEAGVLADVREGDVAAILGWGFAPWSGGPFAWLDRLGAAQACATARTLEAAHGPRFAAPGLLCDMAARGARFRGTDAAAE